LTVSIEAQEYDSKFSPSIFQTENLGTVVELFKGVAETENVFKAVSV
jgi:hypothetical protein